MEISLTRVLSEIKFLEHRIQKAIKSGSYITFSDKRGNVFGTNTNTDEAVKEIQSSYDTVIDLISRRQLLKKVLNEKNACTNVTIGSETMTISETIDRKNTILQKGQFLSAMKRAYMQTEDTIQRLEDQITQKIDQNFMQLSQSKSVNRNTDEYKSIEKMIREKESFNIVDPLKLKNKIDALEKEIDEFDMNVDFALSEINASTFVDV